MTIVTEVLVTGLTFPEGPRWHNNSLWFSDFYSEAVYRLDNDSELTKIVSVAGRPSGLGWSADGDLLVVSMKQQRLLRYDGNQLVPVVDLSPLAGGDCNDMVVAANGSAYIGNFGFDIYTEEPRETVLMFVSPEGELSTAADQMQFPNGSVITDEGRTLIVAESFAKSLTAFDIDDIGQLSNRRQWADLGEYFPDGISMDRQGGIWVATPTSQQVIRVEEGGSISHSVALQQEAYACAVGGVNGESLYICTSGAATPDECIEQNSGRIERLDLSSLL